MSQLIIVESPTKAKKIREYLGKAYKVLASQGHVRDIPGSKEIPAKYKGLPWARLGVDIDNDFTPIYVVSEDRKKQIKELKDALKDAELVYLATDEDREGEYLAHRYYDDRRDERGVGSMGGAGADARARHGRSAVGRSGMEDRDHGGGGAVEGLVSVCSLLRLLLWLHYTREKE